MCVDCFAIAWLASTTTMSGKVNRPMKFMLALPGAVAALAGVAMSRANAIEIYDTITVYDSTDTVIGQEQVTQAELDADPTATYYVAGIAANFAGFGNYSLVDYMGVPIDIFGVSLGGPDGLDLAFAPGLVAATYTAETVYDYTGLPLDMTQYLDPALQADGDTAAFTVSGQTSVTPPVSAVPEPAVAAVLGVGLLALPLVRRRPV
jgi:hypothetical protein